MPTAVVDRPSRRRRWSGFTLMEMLLVLALIGILASVLILNLAPVLDSSETRAARLFVTTTGKTALFNYRLDRGRFPTSQEGLAALVASAADDPAAPAPGTVSYFDPPRVPLDPWGRPYQYRHPGARNRGSYDLFSLGSDGVESTDDIGNW